MATKDELIAQARRLLESAGVDLSSEDGVRAILAQPRDLPAPTQTAPTKEAQPWPRTLPRDQPPPKCASIVNGRRTPEYALAWRCNPRKLKALAMKVDNDDYIMQCLTSFFENRWDQFWTKEAGPAIAPQVFYSGDDGLYYLPAMHNTRFFTDYAKRALDPNDALLIAAKKTLLIDEELEPTLKWYRYPFGARWRGDPRSESDEEEDYVPS